MKKPILSVGMFAMAMWLAGCEDSASVPRFAGRVVVAANINDSDDHFSFGRKDHRAARVESNIGTHGSDIAVSTALSADGSMMAGFSHGSANDDSDKLDWNSDIKWSFLRREEANDVYRFEWTYRPKNGTSRTRATEISFDGERAVKIFSNDSQIIFIKPISAREHSQ